MNDKTCIYPTPWIINTQSYFSTFSLDEKGNTHIQNVLILQTELSSFLH